MKHIPVYEANGRRLSDRPERKVRSGLKRGILTVEFDPITGEITKARLKPGRTTKTTRSYPLNSRRTILRERLADSYYVWTHRPNTVRGKAELQARVEDVLRSIVRNEGA